MIVAIDPGPEKSGWVVANPDDTVKPVVDHAHEDNAALMIRICNGLVGYHDADVVIEDYAAQARPMGHLGRDHCVWIGRFYQAVLDKAGFHADLVCRRDVCRWLTGDPNAKKSQVRDFLIQRWGGKSVAIGCKASPGPLYGLRVHEYDALALALACAEGLRPPKSKQQEMED